jgi:hypothetical protein
MAVAIAIVVVVVVVVVVERKECGRGLVRLG